MSKVNPNLNREHLSELINFLSTLAPERFHMSEVLAVRDCGTVGCIKGWGMVYQAMGDGVELDITLPNDTQPYNTGEWLGLTEAQADRLFFPTSQPNGWSTTDDPYRCGQDGKDAILTELRYLMATGEV